jgi:hypothetical protein
MNTNEKIADLNERIAKWIGVERKNVLGYGYFYFVKTGESTHFYTIDFLHDRNQQKLIEDKLIELGYELTCEYWQGTKQWTFDIYDINQELGHGTNESKDLAFLEAVEQLIDKEK